MPLPDAATERQIAGRIRELHANLQALELARDNAERALGAALHELREASPWHLRGREHTWQVGNVTALHPVDLVTYEGRARALAVLPAVGRAVAEGRVPLRVGVRWAQRAGKPARMRGLVARYLAESGVTPETADAAQLTSARARAVRRAEDDALGRCRQWLDRETARKAALAPMLGKPVRRAA